MARLRGDHLCLFNLGGMQVAPVLPALDLCNPEFDRSKIKSYFRNQQIKIEEGHLQYYIHMIYIYI